MGKKSDIFNHSTSKKSGHFDPDFLNYRPKISGKIRKNYPPHIAGNKK